MSSKFCPECGAEMGESKICEKCGYESKTKAKPKTKEKEKEVKPKVKEEAHPNWPSVENFVSELGKWAWIIGIIDGIIYLIWGFVWLGQILALVAQYPNILTYLPGVEIWYIVGGIVTIVFSFIIIKPRFSDKCAARDWDYLLNDVLQIGDVRIPWMLIWGILIEVFGQWWGGLPILIPALLLIFMGPKPYNWTTK